MSTPRLLLVALIGITQIVGTSVGSYLMQTHVTCQSAQEKCQSVTEAILQEEIITAPAFSEECYALRFGGCGVPVAVVPSATMVGQIRAFAHANHGRDGGAQRFTA
uniref:Uncharacterized protein n=1 Tax=Rhipicephalus appendiculatus TaxID=34631 RepID=A0A131YCJ9_RHIAP